LDVIEKIYFEKKHQRQRILKVVVVVVLALVLLVSSAFSARLKDIAHIEGQTELQVIGYSLVVGLNQTGDNQLSSYTDQSIINMLKRFGLTTTDRNTRTRNVAAVIVTATIPSSTKKGAKIDINVASMGDATSLQGGNLLLSPISDANGRIIGHAQGPVTVGGYDYRSLGSQITKNFVTSGRVPNGLILDQNISSEIAQNQILQISLRKPDFSAVANMQNAISALPGLEESSRAIDASTVEVDLGDDISRSEIISLIAQIENLEIDVNPLARIVINERTGTIVIGGNVKILPSVIAHGGLEISIQRQVIVPQPAPFTILPPRIAETAVIEANEEYNKATALEVGDATVEDIAKALNLLEVTPRDMIAIFQALKDVGALQGELVIQ
jgi:flagellar P-ring protein FlgI